MKTQTQHNPFNVSDQDIAIRYGRQRELVDKLCGLASCGAEGEVFMVACRKTNGVLASSKYIRDFFPTYIENIVEGGREFVLPNGAIILVVIPG